MITWEELVEEVTKLLPNATFGEDKNHQIIIYTNLTTKAQKDFLNIGNDNYDLIDMDENQDEIYN
jgi:hypothetical protein